MSAPSLRGFALPEGYEASVMDQVRSVLEERLGELLRTGRELPDPDALVRAMTAGIPDAAGPATYADLVGPFYSSSGVMRLLSIPTKQALDDRRRRGTVLSARTEDEVWVYPAFQFDPERRRVRANLAPVLAALKQAPRWGAALWLVTEHPELEGLAPERAVDVAHLRDAVPELASQYAEAVGS